MNEMVFVDLRLLMRQNHLPTSDSKISELASSIGMNPSVIYGRFCFEVDEYRFKTSISHTIN